MLFKLLLILSALCVAVVQSQYYGYYSRYGPSRYGSSHYSSNTHSNLNPGSTYSSSTNPNSYYSSYASSYTNPYYGYGMYWPGTAYSRPIASLGYPSSENRVGNDLASFYLACSTCGRG